MPVTLYPRQRQILSFISQYIQKWGYAPTLQEIADALEVTSLATIFEHLEVMEKKGVIRRTHRKNRGIEILVDYFGKPKQEISLPILGIIAAGQPLEPYTDPNAHFAVPQDLISTKRRAFILQVKGDSMVEEGILDGDYVIVEEQETAKDGDIVVALLDNGLATLKRFFKEATRIRLEPANSQMPPIFAKEVRVQGKVVGLIRRY
ncbi:MAG: transcriptional repressor LexA [Microgenomates group bacterium]